MLLCQDDVRIGFSIWKYFVLFDLPYPPPGIQLKLIQLASKLTLQQMWLRIVGNGFEWELFHSSCMFMPWWVKATSLEFWKGIRSPARKVANMVRNQMVTAKHYIYFRKDDLNSAVQIGKAPPVIIGGLGTLFVEAFLDYWNPHDHPIATPEHF